MLTNKPASWDGLTKAIRAVNGDSVKEAIAIQLDFQQPSADVYNFLMRTVDLVVSSGRCVPNKTTPIKSTKTFDELKDHVRKLNLLMEGAEPGLMTWREMTADHMKWIKEYWEEFCQ